MCGVFSVVVVVDFHWNIIKEYFLEMVCSVLYSSVMSAFHSVLQFCFLLCGIQCLTPECYLSNISCFMINMDMLHDLSIFVGITFWNVINMQTCFHVSGGYGSVFLNKARQVEACSCSEILEFPLVLGRDFAGRVVAKGLGVGHDVNIGDEVWGALPPHQQGCHAQFVRVNKSLVSKHTYFTVYLKDEVECVGAVGY